MRHRQSLLWLLVLVLGMPVVSTAQETTGTIVGRVTDQTGAVLPGVTVVARHTETGLTKEVTSAEDGGFTLSYLPVWTYDVTFTLSGFKTFSAKAIELHVNDRIQSRRIALGRRACGGRRSRGCEPVDSGDIPRSKT